jgi:hypothetical protein
MGRRAALSPTEEVLNWQSKNTLAQNEMLKQLDHKIDQVTSEVQHIKQTLTPLEKLYQDMVSHVQRLDKELRYMLATKQTGPEFNLKEQELRKVQKELDRINAEKQAPRPEWQPSSFSTLCPTLPSPSIPGSFVSSPFSFLSTDTNQPLSFFKYYSLELQKQK